MPACSAQRSHSHLKVRDIRTLGSGSLSVTAMLDFSGMANTSIHGLGEDDTAKATCDQICRDAVFRRRMLESRNSMNIDAVGKPLQRGDRL